MNAAFEQLLPFGVTPADFITGVAGVGALITFVLVWLGLVANPASSRRVKEIAARRDDLRKGLLTPRRRSTPLLSISMMRRVVEKLNLQRSAKAEAMAKKLAQAGWRSNDAVIRYLFCKLACPVGFGFGGVFLLEVLELFEMTSTTRLISMAGSVLAGFLAPDLYVKNVADKRIKKIRRALPDALDLMVICAEAGLSLDAMLKRVSEEFGQSSPELADELALTALELGFLPDRRQALQNLAYRVDSPGIRGVVNSLLQADKFGTPLAQSLRVLSAEFREERMLKAEEKAARLPALLTVPMIIFILPPLFIVLIGPAILQTIDALTNL